MKEGMMLTQNPFNPFNPFDESTNGQPFNQVFPPSFGSPGSFPINPPPPPGGNTPMPMGPPPSFSPTMSRSQTGSSGIRRCIYRNTFIWQRNGNSFWFFPTFVSRNLVLGFRWGRFGWTYSTINRDSILTFQCF